MVINYLKNKDFKYTSIWQFAGWSTEDTEYHCSAKVFKNENVTLKISPDEADPRGFFYASINGKRVGELIYEYGDSKKSSEEIEDEIADEEREFELSDEEISAILWLVNEAEGRTKEPFFHMNEVM